MGEAVMTLLLETPRLRLREMTPLDAPAIFAVVGDAQTMLWYPRPFTESEVQEAIERQMELYASGAGLLAMVLKQTGDVIGDTGLVWQDVGGTREPEIGYHVNRAHWNRGYATEAARAVRNYAFAALGCDRVISMIRPENLASRRVAEKNGLAVQRTIVWRGYDHCVYRLEAPR